MLMVLYVAAMVKKKYPLMMLKMNRITYAIGEMKYDRISFL
jgi:hypothetical protein